MAITSQRVEQACGDIEQALEAFRSDGSRTDELQRALAALQWLRDQYGSAPATVGPYVDRLRGLGSAIHECIRSARADLAEEYLW